ncbi:hypothetical protein [uncultured Thiodictyon sp.]|uniref:hypothetical protein n=1 Tax=uncultured Thiodictyon sp. TaxID=1846217 RepID=UPI0025F63C27|nr:hypothetical protein [uncultured Thiodictyon sp.]
MHITTFAKITFGYCLMEGATYLVYLSTGSLPSLSAMYTESPVAFFVYVAIVIMAAAYGRRGYHRIARLARSALPDTPGSDRVSVLFPAIRVFSDPIRYTNRNPRYLNRYAYGMMAFASLILGRALIFPASLPLEGGHAMEMLTMLTVPIFCLILLSEEYYRGYLFQLRYLRRLHAKSEIAKRARYDAEVLRIKNKEQEDVMALVAHKFRGSLDRIVYNTEHENSPWVHREAVNTMRGLLDIFGLISTNTQLLRLKLHEDQDGTATLEEMVVRSLGLALGQLLTQRGSERIQQHFLCYARRTALVPTGTRLRDWHERHRPLAERLRGEWERSLMDLLPRARLTDLCDWVAERFFPLQTQGFTESAIRFTPFGTTGSFLTILFTESFTNLFKYYASEDCAPTQASWVSTGDLVELTLDNPTTPSAAAMVKGSGRGHDFLHLLIEKLDGRVSTTAAGRSFNLTLQLPENLFLEQHP